MLLAAPGKLELWLARTYKMRGLSTWKPQSCSDTKNKHPHTLILLWLCSDVPKINFAVYYIFFHVYMAQGPCTRTQQYRLIEVERKNIYQRKKNPAHRNFVFLGHPQRIDQKDSSKARRAVQDGFVFPRRRSALLTPWPWRRPPASETSAAAQSAGPWKFKVLALNI